jgi:hypothetical protein
MIPGVPWHVTKISSSVWVGGGAHGNGEETKEKFVIALNWMRSDLGVI